jgi:hypothetical protein
MLVRLDLLRHLFRRTEFYAFKKVLRNFLRFTMVLLIGRCLIPFMIPVHDRHAAMAEICDAGCDEFSPKPKQHTGGGRIPTFLFEQLQPHIVFSNPDYEPTSSFKFVEHNHRNVAEARYKNSKQYVIGSVPLDLLASHLTIKDIKLIAKTHGVYAPSKVRAAEGPALFSNHHCSMCDTHVSVFVLHASSSTSDRFKKWYGGLDPEKKKKILDNNKKNEALPESRSRRAKKKKEERQMERENRQMKKKENPFPPSPPSPELTETVIGNWCKDTSPQNFVESGCAVCGQLTPLVKLKKLSEAKCDLEPLVKADMGITRLERFSDSDPIQEIKGPILDSNCPYVCMTCEDGLHAGLTPKYALANGLWLGAVPPIEESDICRKDVDFSCSTK